MKTGKDLVLHFLKDVYFAEKAILKLLPELGAAAHNAALKKALTDHVEQTKSHATRLEKAFAALGSAVEAVTCEAMVGLMQETDDVLKHSSAGPVRDCALVACTQAIHHYLIARYHTLADVLAAMGHAEAASLMKQSGEDETRSVAGLGGIGRREINASLASA